jgi:activating signal cointegrator 1
MLAISLHQPWATAIALSSKHIETRSWPTKYRGALAIHAAKRCVKSELIHISSIWTWRGALNDVFKDQPRNALWDVLPFGAIVAVCELSDCRPTDSFSQAELHTLRTKEGGYDTWAHDWTENMMGNFGLGRYGWVLKNVRALKTPIPWRGGQGFFHVDIEGAL